jgi:ribonuclease P protein subunit POP4
VKVTPDIVRHEFIGTEAKVVKSPNPNCVGLSGKVVDETKYTLTLRRENTKRIIVKNSSVFNIKLADGTVVEIEGKLLEGRPESRLKKTIRRLW